MNAISGQMSLFGNIRDEFKGPLHLNCCYTNERTWGSLTIVLSRLRQAHVFAHVLPLRLLDSALANSAASCYKEAELIKSVRRGR